GLSAFLTGGKSLAPRDKLMAIAHLRLLSKCATLAATFDLANALHSDGTPMHISELAEKVGCNQMNLYRMMSYLSAYGIFHEYEGRRFVNNECSEAYKDTKLRGMLMLHDMPAQWYALGELGVAVKEGGHSFTQATGMTWWGYLSTHPEEEGIFQRAMATISSW